MILYCNINPGLLVLKELQPHQLGEAKQVLDSLSVHRKNIVDHKIQIPVTDEYLVHILESLSLIKIQNPPIERPLKEFLTDLLGRTISPPLPPAKVADSNIAPDIFPSWVGDETKFLWIDCLISALFQRASTEGVEEAQKCNIVATLLSEKQINTIEVNSKELNAILGVEQIYKLPTLATNVEWEGYFSQLESWPVGIDRLRMELYGYRYLNIPLAEISNHRQMSFEPSCLHDIAQETDEDLRRAIIEVMACRVYDQMKPEHDDHTVKGKPGIRRVYVKKMTPSVRLHYFFNGDHVVYCLYSNGKHNKGLK